MDFDSKKFSLGPGERCIIIGEIGVNHNNDESLLFKLIDEGSKAGIDIVKLQRFKASEEIAETAPSTQYQKNAGMGESQLKMAQKLELSDQLLIKAHKYCRKIGIGFLCTAFDHESANFVADTLGCKSVKVPSPEISNKPLIQHMAQKFESLIVSTGASDLSEVARALNWIDEIGHRDVALMHCTSQYPAPIDQANLKAIKMMQSAFNLPIGYSDHTIGIIAGVVSASFGASMIEKHYTLDKQLPGPDHKASANIEELKNLVQAIADVTVSLGDGVKRPVSAEKENIPLIRKSFTCAAEKLEAGSIISREMLGIKRPRIDGAVEPFDLEKIIGLKINKRKSFDEPIMWSDFQ